MQHHVFDSLAPPRNTICGPSGAPTRLRISIGVPPFFARNEIHCPSGDQPGAEIVYELAARPSFDVPEFLLERVLKRNAGRMIEQLREAIAARARQPVPSAECGRESIGRPCDEITTQS